MKVLDRHRQRFIEMTRLMTITCKCCHARGRVIRKAMMHEVQCMTSLRYEVRHRRTIKQQKQIETSKPSFWSCETLSSALPNFIRRHQSEKTRPTMTDAVRVHHRHF